LNEIERNLFSIEEKIKKSCQIYNRNKKEINLIAVSKKVGEVEIKKAISFGCKNFGENYVKEAKEKWGTIKKDFPEIKLHLIGHLQSNKAAEAVEIFDVIQTVDSEKLALNLSKEIKKQNKNPEIFIQVNIGEEPQKNGVMLKEIDDFINFCRNKCDLNLVGLMCVPPAFELASPYFALLTKIAKKNKLIQLSMGMSSDFEEAIAVGATHIRIGTAIFGERNKSGAP